MHDIIVNYALTRGRGGMILKRGALAPLKCPDYYSRLNREEKLKGLCSSFSICKGVR